MKWLTLGTTILTALAVVPPAFADEICSNLSTRWVATAAGRVSNGYPILYVGFSFNYSQQAAASCAGVSPDQIQFQGGGQWGVNCGQTFVKCN